MFIEECGCDRFRSLRFKEANKFELWWFGDVMPGLLNIGEAFIIPVNYLTKVRKMGQWESWLLNIGRDNFKLTVGGEDNKIAYFLL